MLPASDTFPPGRAGSHPALMKIFVLLALLGVSVLANLALVVRLRTMSAAPSAATGAHSPDSGRATVAGASTPETRPTGRSPAAARPDATGLPPAWRAINTDADLRALVGDLRAAGFPIKAIRAIVSAMLAEQMRAGFAKLPFWQRLSPSKETLAVQQAAAREMQTKLEQILGPDGRQSVAMDPVLREQRYGTLSDEKLEAVLKLERDYQEMQAGTARGGAVNLDDIKAQQEQQKLLETEKLTDLASLLSPAELEAYELRNSTSARRVMAGVRDLAVSDEEYAALFRLQKAADAANPREFVVNSGEQMIKRQAAQLALHEQMRTVLSDDRFYKFLEGTDPTYLAVARFAEKNSVTAPATSYQVYQLQIEAQATMVTLSQQSRGAGGNAAALAALTSKLAAYNARLDALLGPQVAAAYRKQPAGRIFNPPAKPTPPPAPTPGGG